MYINDYLHTVCSVCVDTESHILDIHRVRNITAYNEMVCEVSNSLSENSNLHPDGDILNYR